jgi:hypothetical protein
MRTIPNATVTRESLVELGNVLARRLELDARLADLSPAIRAAVQELGATAAGQQSAREEVRFFREARVAAEKPLVRAVRGAHMEVIRAVDFDGKAAVVRHLFPDGVAGLLYDPVAKRATRLQTLVEGLASMPGQEAIGTAVGDAVKAWEAAVAAHREARRQSVIATRAMNAAREALMERYRMAHATVIVRLGSMKAADDVFPTVGGHGRTSGNGNGNGTTVATPASPPPAGPAPAVPSQPHAA